MIYWKHVWSFCYQVCDCYVLVLAVVASCTHFLTCFFSAGAFSREQDASAARPLQHARLQGCSLLLLINVSTFILFIVSRIACRLATLEVLRSLVRNRTSADVSGCLVSNAICLWFSGFVVCLLCVMCLKHDWRHDIVYLSRIHAHTRAITQYKPRARQ